MGERFWGIADVHKSLEVISGNRLSWLSWHTAGAPTLNTSLRDLTQETGNVVDAF